MLPESGNGRCRAGRGGQRKKKIYLTFPQELIKRPVLWELVKNHDIIPNIRSASVSHEIGLIALEIEGRLEDIDAAQIWLEEIGIIVEPLEKNVIE